MLLITGSNGQLGMCLAKLLPDALLADVDTLDITDLASVRDFVASNNIDTIVNCAAYTAVDKAEDDVELAEKINVLGVENLALSGAKIVHISTDYVFDGTSCVPYQEDDAPNPKSVYGKTKFAGEQVLLEKSRSAVIIRTAWLYSEYGNNFVKTMRRLGAERDVLKVVFDQVGTPTYAGDLAEAIVKILPTIKYGEKRIYHFSNEGVCSWYDFACEIMKLSGLACKVLPIESSEYPTKAARPSFSVLNKSKIKSDFSITIPHWTESLARCIKQF